MQFEEALYLHLTNTATLSSLVTDRVFPLILPQNCLLPAITYQKISGERLHSLYGDTGYTSPVFQLSCWAQSYAQCKALAEEVRISIQNFSGLMGGTDGVYIDAVLMLSELEEYEPDTGTYYIHMDFGFCYTEKM